MEAEPHFGLHATTLTMKIWSLSQSVAAVVALVLGLPAASSRAQAMDAADALARVQIESSVVSGRVPGAVYAPDGSVILIVNEQDGIRLRKVDAELKRVVAEVHIGTSGDSVSALSIDEDGDVSVVGTSESGAVLATSGAAFIMPQEGSKNSFLAKYDGNLNRLFLTFLGDAQEAATGVASSSNGVVVMGLDCDTRSSVSVDGLEQPVGGALTESGFFERFSADGSTLEDATPLNAELAHEVCVIVLRHDASADTEGMTPEGQQQAAGIASAVEPMNTRAAATVNPGLSVSASSLTFAAGVVVTQVSSSAQILTVKNTGQSSFPVSLAASGDFTLLSGCPATLTAASSCVVEVSFAPSQPGDREGVLSITTTTGYTPTYVSLSGTGLPLLPANNGTLDLGETLAGEPEVAWYKVEQPITSLTAVTSGGVFGVAFVTDTGSGHGTLPASSFAQSATANCNNCWLGVQFLSPLAGSAVGSLTLTSNQSGGAYSLELTAVALPVAGVVLTPMMQDFGPVPVHSASAAETFALTNLLASSAAFTVTSVAVSGDFEVAANTSGGPSCTGTISATASCFVQVSFAPTATGARSGSLTVVTSAGTVTAALNGTGTADPGIAIIPTALLFASVPGSTSTVQTVTLTNTGTASLTIGSPTASDPSFAVTSSCGMLQAGASCALTVSFAPQPGMVTATLSIPVSAANGQTTYSVPLSATYTAQSSGMEIVPGSVNFGSMDTGGLGSTREFTLNNLTAEPLSVTLALPRQFPLADPQACSQLPANGSCSFSVSFLPVTGGPLTGTVSAQGVSADGSVTTGTLAYMSGYGAAQGSLLIGGNTIPNAPVSFGQVVSGQSSQQVLTLTNNGTGTLTIRRITSEPPFLSVSNCGATLAPSASCSVTITYAPIYEVNSDSTVTTRNDVGTLVVESDAATSPNAVVLSGIAVAVVSADPSTSAVLSVAALSEGALTFANTQVGNVSVAQQVSLTNVGNVTIHILSVAASTDFGATTSCGTLLPGAACSVAVTFQPTAATTSNVRSGALSILSDAGTSLEFVSLLGSSAPAALTLSPTALDFGTVDVGGQDSLAVTVTNTGATPVTFLGLTASGDYTVSAGACPADGGTLAAGAVCVLTVSFKPSTTGTRTGTLSLTNDATQLPLTVSLTGNAVEAMLTVSPGALAFGSIDVGSPALLSIELLNTGTASVTGISGLISGANAGDFAVTAPCSTTSLAPNQGCTATVTFTPSATGARVATLSIGSSDPRGPATIALSGTGVAAGSFTLTVNGTNAATLTVASGSPATYPLLLTPAHAFSGVVALTCTPVTAGEYASCSLLSSTLTLGSTALTSTATINTITSEAGATMVAFAGVFAVPFAWLLRRRTSRGKRDFGALLLCAMCWVGVFSAGGCGGGGGSVASRVQRTPPGTYQYVVTARSTSGAAVSSSVTLTLVVQ